MTTGFEEPEMSTPVQKLFDLTGQFALVTGGSRGLGLQMAEALGEAGAKIMLTSRKAARKTTRWTPGTR
jgi:gluconate 5-dehydrogenase